MTTKLINRLASFPNLSGIPRRELKWLVDHGHFATYPVGTVVGPKGERVKYLWIILSGKIAIRVDRGVGPRLVTEWGAGEVTGMLPYSRMKGPPGDNFIEEEAEVLAIEVTLFPKMILTCPDFTAYTVHNMLDRVRNFNSSDLQDEKMISLGKLSAGLAHELNNPASATVRNAKLLQDGLANLDAAARGLGTANLDKMQFSKIKNLCAQCLAKSDGSSMSPIQKADQQDTISEWLENHQINPAFAIPLVENSFTIKELDTLASLLPGANLDLILKWIEANCSTFSLSVEIEYAATQIYKVVDAVKKFTYMDNLAGKELVDIESGIRDTMNVLIAKTNAKCAGITLEIDEDLPQVYANGSDLNQVWFSILDNALDAISKSGNIRIEAGSEMDRVEVRVVDDGPGITPEAISKIFDPFFTTKPPGHGTGLGLEIARRLIRRYHGDISVSSQPGQTEFRVSLLITKPETSTAHHENEDLSGE